jgi:energy-coupling factor transporter ATP-binding protein EcfA2
MSETVDSAYARLAAFRGELESSLKANPNEAAMRFEILDRVLIEGLGWNRQNIDVEDATTDGFVDYTLCAPDGTPVGIIEAKRTGKLVVGTASTKLSALALKGSVLKSMLGPTRQALGYAAEKSVPIACVTDGNRWLFFQTNRRDGKPPLDGKGIFFPNLASVFAEFPRFHDLLSPEGFSQRLGLVQLNRGEGLVTSGEEDQAFVSPANLAKMHERNALSQDASLLFKQFFSSITSESDRDMLSECFVETSESKKADLEIQKITQKLLNGIKSIDSSDSLLLQNEIERTLTTLQSETILLVGNKGSGKSTFLSRFFRSVLDPKLRGSCVVLRIQLDKCPRNERASLAEWALRQLRDQVESHVCKGERATYDDLRGVFYSEYQRKRDGALEPLYRNDPEGFRTEFGLYLERFREAEPEKYVQAFLERSVVSDKKLPIVIFDNADNYPSELQDAVFQLAHAIGQSATVLNIVPITDRTVWRLSKSGALQSYNAQSFYLPVPEAKQVLRKRIDFVKRRLNEDPDLAKSYFSAKGFRVTLDNIDRFAEAVERLFVDNDFVSGLIGRLANFDIRRMLRIAERIFMSPETRIDEVVKGSFGFQPGQAETLRIHRALIKGEYDRYVESENTYILNLFWTDRISPASPLLAYYLLWTLRQRLSLARADSVDSRHWTAGELARFFEAAGVSMEQTMVVLQRLRDRALIEPHDPNILSVGSGDRVAITEAGVAHIELCLNSAVYLEQMALATGINDKAVFNNLRIERDKANSASFENIRRSFVDYVVALDTVRLTLPQVTEYEALRDAKKTFRGKGTLSMGASRQAAAQPPRSAPAVSIGSVFPRRR